MTDMKTLKLMANTVRQDIIRSLHEAKSGHSAGSMGMADVFTAFYFAVLNHDPKNPKWEGRDYFLLSAGHICPGLYAAMANAGYFPKEELMTLRKLGTRLQGHPHRTDLPGLESTSGPLGEGISQAAGMAYALKMDNKPNTVFCLTSDGEQQEGNVWEGIMFAAKNKLDNLVCIMDRNFIQIDGNTEDVMPLEPLGDKYRAFNWNVIDIDGNDMAQIVAALEKGRAHKGSPTMILAKNIPGKGVSFMEGDHNWHGRPPNTEEKELALKELADERITLEAGK
ncbi:MAG: transketolase [Nanoarchaeota archaeon]